MPDDLRPDLDRLILQRAQGPVLNTCWQRKPTHEVYQVVRQGRQLKPHLLANDLRKKLTACILGSIGEGPFPMPGDQAP